MDIVGKKFGLLTVLSKVSNGTKEDSAQYLCLCDCGDYCVLRRYTLLDHYGKKCNRHKHYVFSDGVISTKVIEDIIKENNCVDSDYAVSPNVVKRILDNCKSKSEAIEEAKLKKIRGSNARHIVFGEIISIKQASIKYNIDYNQLKLRYRRNNISLEEAVQQMLNMVGCKNKKYLYKGEYLTMRQLSEISGKSRDLIESRISRGWNVEEAVEKPLSKPGAKGKLFEYNGELMTIKEIYEMSSPDIKFGTFKSRLNKGWSVEAAIETPLICKLH